MHDDAPVPGSKRRRLRGSCDICKQRKIKCDSAQMPGKRCSNCISFNSECTHRTKSSSRTPKSAVMKSPASQDLPDAPELDKAAQAHVAAIVKQATAYIAESDVRQVMLDVALYARSLESRLIIIERKRSPSVANSVTTPSSAADSPSSPPVIKEEEDDMFVNGTLTERFDRFRLDTDRNRYFGKSSHFDLINTAMGIKDLFVEPPPNPRHVPTTKRLEFWGSPWELAHLTHEDVPPPLVFPAPDLLHSLVALFFEHVNPLLCLLHRPTFEKALAVGLHMVDHKFGSLVLGVCAVAAKYSDDSRVVLEGTNTRLSSGWAYFCQLQSHQKASMRSWTLHEAQTLCLTVIYLQGSSAPDGCWTLGGVGLRYAQEVGVHRRNLFSDKVVDEQWKRVFWVLICIDILSSAVCGRPRATFSDGYDIDYPAECDDEYWETSDPAMAFKQPPGRPSVVSYTIAYLKLIEILGMAQTTIYVVRRTDQTKESLQKAVFEIDSALNAWIDTIPEHLRWDPQSKDPLFSKQSAALYASYYHVQIQVHRIFIVVGHGGGGQSVTTDCPQHYPSLAICASSSRACSHVLDIASRRGFLFMPYILNAGFQSCIMLLLSVWAGRQVGLAIDPQKCLQDVKACLRVFRFYETRFQMAGRVHDIITELMCAANMEVEVSSIYHDAAPSASDTSTYSQAASDDTGSSGLHEPNDSDASFSSVDPLVSLPMYTEDLGRLPVYEPLNWSKDVYKITLPDHLESLATTEYSSGQNAMLLDSMSFFNEVPGGYDWNEWGKYITNVEEVMQSFDNHT